ncbi:MAG TPA: TlpA disulfide reductase family protein [Burkholderiaceae bacterium]
MQLARLAAVLFGALLAAAPAYSQSGKPSTQTELQIKDMTGLQDYQLEYKGLKGETLSLDQFNLGRAESPSFSIAKNKETKIATLQLRSKEELAKQNAQMNSFKLKAGDAIPAFALVTADSAPITEQSLQGKVTLVNFMFAECAPCIKEVPELNTLQAERKDLAYAALTFDKPEIAKKFATDTKFAWPMIANGKDLLSQIGVRGFPAFALVGADGKLLGLAQRFEIMKNGGSLEKWVDSLLPKKAG